MIIFNVVFSSFICRTKTFKTIEASLRVDALASAGFKISRSKLVDLIRWASGFLLPNHILLKVIKRKYDTKLRRNREPREKLRFDLLISHIYKRYNRENK